MPGRTGRVNPVKNDLYEAWAWRSTALTADQRGRWRCAVCGTGQARRTSQREVFALKLIDQHSAERRPAGLGPSGQAAACAARAVDCRTPALVAQRIEHLTTDQKVGGSSPSERATAPQVRVHFQAWPTPRVTAQEPVFSQFLTALNPARTSSSRPSADSARHPPNASSSVTPPPTCKPPPSQAPPASATPTSPASPSHWQQPEQQPSSAAWPKSSSHYEPDHCRIEPYRDQERHRCAAPRPASAVGLAVGRHARRTPGHMPTGAPDQGRLLVTFGSTAPSRLPRLRLSSSRSPSQWRPSGPSRAIGCAAH